MKSLDRLFLEDLSKGDVIPIARSKAGADGLPRSSARASAKSDGDEDFVRFVDEVLPKLWRLVQRSGLSHADAEDIAAEALARAYASWQRIGKAPHRDGWVLRTATNLLYDRLRREQRSKSAPMTVDATVPGFETRSADRATLMTALGSLSRRQRQAIVLRYWGDLEVQHVADAMGVSAGTAQTHLTRARTNLVASLALTEGPS